MSVFCFENKYLVYKAHAQILFHLQSEPYMKGSEINEHRYQAF